MMLGVTGKHSFVFPSIVRVVWLISGCVYWMTVTLAMECAPTFRYDRLVPQRTPPSPQLNPHHPTPIFGDNFTSASKSKGAVEYYWALPPGQKTHYKSCLNLCIHKFKYRHPLSNHLHSISHGGQRAFLPDDHRGTIIHCLFFVLN